MARKSRSAVLNVDATRSREVCMEFSSTVASWAITSMPDSPLFRRFPPVPMQIAADDSSINDRDYAQKLKLSLAHILEIMICVLRHKYHTARSQLGRLIFAYHPAPAI